MMETGKRGAKVAGENIVREVRESDGGKRE